MSDKGKIHSPKAYRIYPLYYNLFNACLTVINRDNLSDYLIRRYYNIKDLPRLSSDKKESLLEKMILDIYNSNEDIETIKQSRNSLQMIDLQEYYRIKNIDINKPRQALVIRVPQDVDDKIKELAKKCNTIGEVIEIAIAYHITKESQKTRSYYDLITFTIQNQSIQEQKRKSEDN